MKTSDSPIRLEPQLPLASRTAAHRADKTPLSEPQDRYRILNTLGEGGLGVVSRAHDRRLDREVAIKRLHPNPQAGAANGENLKREARILASVNHPNIVSVYDVYEENGEVCIVMELLDGVTLAESVRSARFSVSQLGELVVQSQDALAAARGAGIVHGDIKPQNIVQTRDPIGRPLYKLLDFDQARITGANDALGKTHSTFGSIYFMAPERFEGGAPTHAADTYAAGCLYYLALTGEFPLQGDTNVEIMAAHLRNDIAPLQKLRPDLPEWVCKWVHWLMHRKASERPQSPRAVKESFLELRQRFSSVPENITRVPATAPAKAEERWLVARGSQTGGPHTWETVQSFLNADALKTTDLIKSDSMDGWMHIGDLVDQRMRDAG